MQKKKIMFVQHSSKIGGASWCLVGILQELDRDRFDPIVVLFRPGPLEERIRVLEIQTVVLSGLVVFPVYEFYGVARGIYKFIISLLLYIRCFIIFFNYCRAINPDAVYLNSSALLPLSWPAKKARIKIVLLHNREHWEHHGIMRLKNLVKNWIVSRYVDRIFHITEAGSSQFGDFGKSSVVRDWPMFDNEKEKDVRRELGISPDAFILLVPGGMDPAKGTKDVIMALRHMQYSNHVAVVVLGCRQIELSWWRTIAKHILRRGIYPDQISRISLKDNRIILLPSTTQMKSYIEASNAVICPFVLSHAAKASLESQSLGRPVVMYDNPEAHEYVRNGYTGVIVPCRDIQKLAATIDELIINENRTIMMGKAGPNFIRNKFSQDRSMKTLTDAFEGNLS